MCPDLLSPTQSALIKAATALYVCSTVQAIRIAKPMVDVCSHLLLIGINQLDYICVSENSRYAWHVPWTRASNQYQSRMGLCELSIQTPLIMELGD